MTVIWLTLAGSAGAVARFVLDGAVRAVTTDDFPYGTLLVNVTGSLVLGVLTGLVLYHGASGRLAEIGGTGFCGGYTTFSAASFETVRLIEMGDTRAAIANALGTLLLCVSAGAAGLLLMSF